jgi:hypothetical protein
VLPNALGESGCGAVGLPRNEKVIGSIPENLGLCARDGSQWATASQHRYAGSILPDGEVPAGDEGVGVVGSQAV